jgi:4-hydroxy-tetrahydrodipicolinate reductase
LVLAQVAYFQKLGLDFKVSDINKIRDPEVQKNAWGVPDAYLGGHA